MLEILKSITQHGLTPDPDAELHPTLAELKTIAQGVKQELCGFILKTGELVQVDNTHEDPVNHFRVSVETLTEYKRESIAAIWHTHWSDQHPGELTIDDINIAHHPNRFPMLLYHTGFDCWDYYDPQCHNPYPLRMGPKDRYSPEDLGFYLDWPFVWGRMDCFSLVRRYTMGSYGRDIGEWPRPEEETFPVRGWSCTAWDRAAAGLIEVHDRPRVGDILEIALGGGREPNHLAVIVGMYGIANLKLKGQTEAPQIVSTGQEPVILHNPGFRCLSRVEVYDRPWQSRTVRRLRFN